MKKNQIIFFITLLSILGIFLIYKSKAHGDTSLYNFKPDPPRNFSASVTYTDTGKASVKLYWDSSDYFVNTDVSTDSTLPTGYDDVGYQIFRQELKSDSLNADGQDEMIIPLNPGDSIEDINYGGFVPFKTEELIGNLSRKIKYTLVAWDKSVGLTDDINNHITEVSTTVEIKSKNDVCAAQ